MSKLRPGVLSSKALRATDSRHPLRGELASYIDTLANQFDALNVLHTTADPQVTKGGHALKVKGAVLRTVESNGKRAVSLVERLSDYESSLINKARERAGLMQPFPESHLSELRSALRQMTFDQRERAIKNAFDKNDVAVIRAVQDASSPVLVGDHKLPIDVMVNTFLHKHNPELMQDLEETKELTDRLDIVSDSFIKAVNSLRDVALEDEAEQKHNAAKAAMAALDPFNS